MFPSVCLSLVIVTHSDSPVSSSFPELIIGMPLTLLCHLGNKVDRDDTKVQQQPELRPSGLRCNIHASSDMPAMVFVV